MSARLRAALFGALGALALLGVLLKSPSLGPAPAMLVSLGLAPAKLATFPGDADDADDDYDDAGHKTAPYDDWDDHPGKKKKLATFPGATDDADDDYDDAGHKTAPYDDWDDHPGKKKKLATFP